MNVVWMLAGAAVVWAAMVTGRSYSEKHTRWLVQELRTQAEKVQQAEELRSAVAKLATAMLEYEKAMVKMNDSVSKLVLMTYSKTTRVRDLQVGEESNPMEATMGRRVDLAPTTPLSGTDGLVSDSPPARNATVFSQPT